MNGDLAIVCPVGVNSERGTPTFRPLDSELARDPVEFVDEFKDGVRRIDLQPFRNEPSRIQGPKLPLAFCPKTFGHLSHLIHKNRITPATFDDSVVFFPISDPDRFIP
jgi:hypothetical protein